MNEEVEVIVSNLPNTTPHKDIIQYLQTAGPIKDSAFHEEGQRLSAKIIYYNIESADMAKKYLGERQFNARKIRISYDSKKYSLPDQGNLLLARIANMRTDDKKLLFGYLKKLRDEEGEMFQAFLQENPQLVSALLAQKF